MTQPFSELVADYLKDIASALRHPQQSPALEYSSPNSSKRLSSHPKKREDFTVFLPEKNIDDIPGGSYMLRDEISNAQSYLIFMRQKTNDPFVHKATLDTELDISRFVDNAYIAILQRPADEAGRSNYLPMLKEGRLRPTDLLLALASSTEFRDRPSRIVIVPQTSRWLSHHAVDVEALEIRSGMPS